MIRCLSSVAPLNRLFRGGRILRSWFIKFLRGPRLWGPHGRGIGGPPGRGGPSHNTAGGRGGLGGPNSSNNSSSGSHSRSGGALHQLLSRDGRGLALLMARNVAAAAAAASFEGLCVTSCPLGFWGQSWALCSCCCCLLSPSPIHHAAAAAAAAVAAGIGRSVVELASL